MATNAKVKLSVNKTVPIPVVRGNKKIAALIEVGGMLFSKNQTYEMFFEEGYPAVEKKLRAELNRKGGDDSEFKKLFDRANVKVQERYRVN